MQRTFSYILLITWFIVSTGCKTSFVKTSVDSDNMYVSGTEFKPDSQVVKMYLPYKEILEEDMSKIISITEEEMVKDRPESALTNFLADLLLLEATKIADTLNLEIEPDISFFNYGGIRTFLPKGNITVGEIYELMPFENQLVYLKLSGNQIQELLDNIANKGGGSLGGVRFKIAGNKAKDVMVNGQLIDDQSNYWLVTNDYVASGGDGMEMLKSAVEKIASGKKIRDIIIAHLTALHKRNQKISAQTDGRIQYE